MGRIKNKTNKHHEKSIEEMKIYLIELKKEVEAVEKMIKQFS